MKPDKEIKAKNVLLFSKRFNEARLDLFYDLKFFVQSIYFCV